MEARHGLPETVPFYLNGWRAYSSHSELFDDAPPPYFTEAVDHTRLILQQVRGSPNPRPNAVSCQESM